jgi:hypothetical protein
MAFTVMSWRPSSTASAYVRASWPPLAAE